MLIEFLSTGIYKYRTFINGTWYINIITYRYLFKTKQIVLTVTSEVINPSSNEITVYIPWSDEDSFPISESAINITPANIPLIANRHPFNFMMQELNKYGLNDTEFSLHNNNLCIHESGIIKLEQNENLKHHLTALNFIRTMYSDNLAKIKKLFMQIIYNKNEFFSCFLPTPELDRKTGTIREYGLPPAFYYFKVKESWLDQPLAKELTAAIFHASANIFNKICRAVDFKESHNVPTEGIVGSVASSGRANSLEQLIYKALSFIKDEEPLQQADPIEKIIPEQMPDTYEQLQRLLEAIIVPYKMKIVAMRQSKALKTELINKIKLFFSRVNNIEHLNKLYEYINQPYVKEIINVHRHSILDSFLFWKEQTESWQVLIKYIREQCVMSQIQIEVEKEGNTVEDKKTNYQKYLHYSSLNQHRSNNPFARLFDTHTVKTIKENMTELEKSQLQLKV